MTHSPVILWFRQDLRLADNPALLAAHKEGRPVLPVYILDTETPGEWAWGGASKAWLHRSLDALNKSMDGHLVFLRGDPAQLLPTLIRETKAESVYYNRCYEPSAIKRDTALKKTLQDSGIAVHSFNGSLLWEPWQPLKEDGTPYKVFTPFRKACVQFGEPREPQASPRNLQWATHTPKGDVADLDLLPQKPEPRWDNRVISEWEPGEAGAAKRLEAFLEQGLSQYSEGRDIPSSRAVSRLSPHLHWGEISPNTAWYAARDHALAHHQERNLDRFHAELTWREFSYSLLYHNPTLPEVPLQAKFANFPWAKTNENDLVAWQKGQTGYPIVDAGMRELWQTGYMHNRVRMIVGSFLVKHLLLPWQLGEAWFWDCLFDADLANNSASWQWIAGCGADAAPYFRIFNPIIQGEKFDGKGEYVRRYVPELARLPDKYLHQPWDADEYVLAKAGVKLGKDYPKPIVDHGEARDRAMAAFQSLSD